MNDIDDSCRADSHALLLQAESKKGIVCGLRGPGQSRPSAIGTAMLNALPWTALLLTRTNIIGRCIQDLSSH